MQEKENLTHVLMFIKFIKQVEERDFIKQVEKKDFIKQVEKRDKIQGMKIIL